GGWPLRAGRQRSPRPRKLWPRLWPKSKRRWRNSCSSWRTRGGRWRWPPWNGNGRSWNGRWPSAGWSSRCRRPRPRRSPAPGERCSGRTSPGAKPFGRTSPSGSTCRSGSAASTGTRSRREVSRMRRRKWWIAVPAMLAAVAVVVALVPQVRGRLVGGAEEAAGVASLPTFTVRRGSVVQTISATGNVQPARLVDLRFGTQGRVKEVLVEAGDRVEAGQVLAVLDNRQQELAYFQARNAYEIARIDGAPHTVRQREIDMQLAQAALQQPYLRAPFAGVITAVYVEPGQTVTPNEAAVQLMDDSSFLVEVAVDELDIARVQVGQTAAIRTEAAPCSGKPGCEW